MNKELKSQKVASHGEAIALAIEAAETSHQLKIPMADSLILTTARAHQALLWTQDVDFKGIDGVRYIKKT